MPSREEKLGAYASKLAREDPNLRRIRTESDKHRKAHGCDVHPSDAVTGRMLDVLVRATRARRVLEVGCGLGLRRYLACKSIAARWKSRHDRMGLTHAKLAVRNFKSTRVDDKVRILRGDAGSVLSRLRGPMISSSKTQPSAKDRDITMTSSGS